MSEQSTPEPQPCLACRETGKVISGLGGTNQQVTCPWCEGTGRIEPGHNAQEAGARLRGDAGS
ncbi:MAG TPA: hypothetical protein VFZ89_11920 [Solirubrobacteraceae bacterium]